ncbi:DUF1631 family protein [Parahaliea aestuarii]|nr:DUF1631 family protein [Parahaliea aestuarii]
MNSLSANDLPLPADLSVAYAEVANLARKAFSNWLSDVDVADSVKAHLALLESTVLSIARTDQDFLSPGQHPLHRLLDWAGVAFAGVDDTSSAGQNALAILQALCRMLQADDAARQKLSSALRVSQDRLQRLVTEHQRQADESCQPVNRASRQLIASLQVAETLNQYLDTPLPEAVGEFLSGPWRTCGSLTLETRGRSSEGWKVFSSATERLIQVVSPGEMTQARRRQALEFTSALPRILERLCGDNTVEYGAFIQSLFGVEQVLLQIARGTEPKTGDIPLLQGREVLAAGASEYFSALNDWYRHAPGSGHIRIRLGAVDIGNDRLQFYRFDGELQLELSSLEAEALAHRGELVPLATRHAAFSLALAAAAGIATTDDFRREFGVPPPRVQKQQAQENERQRRDVLLSSRQKKAELASREAARRLQAETEMQAEAARQEEAVLEYRKRFEARARAAIAEQRRRREAEESGQHPAETDAPAAQASEPAIPEDAEVAQYREHRKRFFEQELTAVQAAASLEADVAATASGAAEQAAESIKGTIGTWYAFHDGRIPLLAKLAGFEKVSGQFLFTNRQGHLIRKLVISELTELIASGQFAAVTMVFFDVGSGH